MSEKIDEILEELYENRRLTSSENQKYIINDKKIIDKKTIEKKIIDEETIVKEKKKLQKRERVIDKRIENFRLKRADNKYSDNNYDEDMVLINENMKYIYSLFYLYNFNNSEEQGKLANRILNLQNSVESLREKTYYFENILSLYKNESLKEELTKLVNASKKQKKEYNKLGYTVLNMIITFTMISTAITAIDEIDSKYIPLFCFVIVWMAITVIAFDYSIFSSDKASLLSKKIYITITILTVIVFIVTVLFAIYNK